MLASCFTKLTVRRSQGDLQPQIRKVNSMLTQPVVTTLGAWFGISTGQLQGCLRAGLHIRNGGSRFETDRTIDFI
jgi:hypothetical protein